MADARTEATEAGAAQDAGERVDGMRGVRRAVVVANKWWEADPLVAVLRSARSSAAGSRFVESGAPGLRGWIDGARGRVEIWCLQDLIPLDKSGSSTQAKADVLPAIVERPGVALVVAFGTAASPADQLLNGSVVIGTNAFLHDPQQPNPISQWRPPVSDRVIASSIAPNRFAALFDNAAYTNAVESSLLGAPLPGPPDPPPPTPTLLAQHDFTALASINVNDYAFYDTGDQSTVDAFKKSGGKARFGSLETTHGVIRAVAGDARPFVFVSGITDRVGFFAKEVAPRKYAQNFVAAHNAAIAVSYLVPSLHAYLVDVSQ
jgi:hypothetical protein